MLDIAEDTEPKSLIVFYSLSNLCIRCHFNIQYYFTENVSIVSLNGAGAQIYSYLMFEAKTLLLNIDRNNEGTESHSLGLAEHRACRYSSRLHYSV